MNNFTINDTFDNFSFSASGQLITMQDTSTTHPGKLIQNVISQSVGTAFDDSVFLADAEFTESNTPNKENIPPITCNSQLSNLQSTSLNLLNSLNQCQYNENKTTKVVDSQSMKTPKAKTLSPSFASTPNAPSPSHQPPDYSLSRLGLPAQILQKYHCRNVTVMFPWQFECLSCKGVLDECRNLIYSAPTSAGKTLVAEIIAIKTVLERNKKVLFILPFVSVVREKMFYFQDIFGTSGIRVDGFMGSYHPPGGFKMVNVAICTIEKANSIVNKLLEEGKLSDIGCIIVDELHLLGDSSRGYLLELLLTKLRYVSQKDENVKVQIVGMSATLPNLDVLGTWLDSALYVTTFRPIPLVEQCIHNGEVYNSNFLITRNLEKISELETDSDNVLQLCLETILSSCSVLIFCPTKNWCENLGVQLATAFYKLGTSGSKLGGDLRSQLLPEPIVECLEQLRRSPAGLDDILHKTVSFGVAFHHAGLTMDERDIIENAFRTGAIRVLVATSTLSSGVNLPARRVIIRTPMYFNKPIDVLTYKQMVGRAGRMGKDTCGESILICQKNDLPIARDLMNGQLHAVGSCLAGSGRLKRALLEIIASGVAATPEEIDLFGACTLLSQEGGDPESLQHPLTEALDFLIKYQFVRFQTDSNRYVATGLARACLNASMPPEDGLALFVELEKARQCCVLETDLHLIYLVTPFSAQISSVDWMEFLNMWEKLPASMKRVGELVGVKESFIVNNTRGKNTTDSRKLAIHIRFYTALALQDLVNETPLGEVAQKYNCNRGALQSLQQNAASFAGMVTAFAKQLGWHNLELLVGQFQDRLQFGVGRELLDLMRLPILNGQRARMLFNAGVETLVDLAGCDACELENILQKAAPFESKEREGESKRDAEKRHAVRTIFITGQRGLTELEAARLMIGDARKYLQYACGMTAANWTRTDEDIEILPKQQEGEVVEVQVKLEDSLEDNLKDSLEVKENSKDSLECDEEVEEVITPVKAEIPVNRTHFEISASPSSISLRVPHDSHNKTSHSVFNDSFNQLLNSNNIKENHDTLADEFMNSFNESLKLNPEPHKPLKLTPNKQLIHDMSMCKAFMDTFNESKFTTGNNINTEKSTEIKLTQDLFESSWVIQTATQDELNLAQAMHNISLENPVEVEVDVKYKRKNSVDASASSQHVYKRGRLSSDEVFLINSSIDDEQRSESTRCIMEIVHVCANAPLYDLFLEYLRGRTRISLSAACVPYVEEKQVIGIQKHTATRSQFTYRDRKLIGLCVYCVERLEGEPEVDANLAALVYFIEFEKLLDLRNDALKELELVLTTKTWMVYKAKELLKLLHFCVDWAICDVKVEDPCIADWLLDAEGHEKGFHSMVKSYLTSFKQYLDICEKPNKKNPTDVFQTVKLNACVESVVNWSLTMELCKRLIAEDSKYTQCFEIEMKVITILAKMEITGVPVDIKSLQAFSDTLKRHIGAIETEAYAIAGKRFSFTSSAAVARVLNMHQTTTTKRKTSTNKAALLQVDNPLASLIMQWRKINCTLTKIIYPLLRCVDGGRIRGTCISHNSTGRICMHEPNVQNVPRNFEFVDPITQRTHQIRIRDAFTCTAHKSADMILIAADYCQLELRLLAHLSRDSALSLIMRGEDDIFKSIAAKWMHMEEEEVDDGLRQRTKQICYGIIYGIGNKSLAEQMNISEQEAKEFCESFHAKYPCIEKYIKRTVRECRENGYVDTLLGRRRFLPLINSEILAEKSKAERQAVNTTIQGSAADIAKQAMIMIDKKIREKFSHSRNAPKFILQLHDELLYEVPRKYELLFGKILRKCMQGAVKLFVPLPVKVQSGKSWGSLVPLEL